MWSSTPSSLALPVGYHRAAIQFQVQQEDHISEDEDGGDRAGILYWPHVVL